MMKNYSGNKINYQIELDHVIANLDKRQILLLHSCCGPCSSYVLEYLREYFDIIVYYYNPNISPAEEYQRRYNEQVMLIDELNELNPEYSIRLIEGEYDCEFYEYSMKGLELEPEGGVRCYHCYELRLREAAIVAKRMGADYYTTTLTISPHKNADWINEIGDRVACEYGVRFLPSDFKKREGYKRSIELTKEYNMYRQDYCGCRNGQKY